MRNATAAQYADWQRRIAKLQEEVECAHGENLQGAYPEPLEMALRLAWLAAYEAHSRASDTRVIS